jgi:hypothetical protein
VVDFDRAPDHAPVHAVTAKFQPPASANLWLKAEKFKFSGDNTLEPTLPTNEADMTS